MERHHNTGDIYEKSVSWLFAGQGIALLHLHDGDPTELFWKGWANEFEEA